MIRFTSLAFCFLLVGTVASSATPTKDVTFATVDGHELKLNLFLPDDVQNPPLVVFIHGGGWKNGSYKGCRVDWLAEHGFAVASIGYRLTDKATYPAQVHDCKAGVRWLRAHADDYGYDATRIGVAGTSAGGHLAMMIGMTGDHEELEGTVGGNLEHSSRVDAIVDYFGPSDFLFRSKTNPAKTENKNGSVWLLLGGPVSKKTELAKLASPVYHVSKDDPPMLILHGENDKTVYLNQAERINEAYEQAGLDVTFEVLPGAGHGGKVFFEGKSRRMVVEFFNKHLRSRSE